MKPRTLPEFGVLLTNLGSPTAPTAGAVRSYLREFLADRRVVDLPRVRWWLIRNLFILPFRPRRSAELYRKIWTDAGSPLTITTRRLGEALESRLGDTTGEAVPVEVAMRYGPPSISEGLRALADTGCARVVVLPLYPQYSTTTTASAQDAVSETIESWDGAPRTSLVSNYHDHRAYLGALQSTIEEFWGEHGRADRLLMSFHGIPLRTVESGDPYPKHCAATAKALARRLDLGPGRWHMAYQSKFGQEPWLRPQLEDRLLGWGRSGITGVDIVCPGFAVDCLETLEEVAISNRERFEGSGGRNYRYIPALNDRREHVDALAEIVTDHMGPPTPQKTSSR